MNKIASLFIVAAINIAPFAAVAAPMHVSAHTKIVDQGPKLSAYSLGDAAAAPAETTKCRPTGCWGDIRPW